MKAQGSIVSSEYTPRLKQLYQDELHPALMEQFGYDNEWQVPQLVKICVNMDISEPDADGGAESQEQIDNASNELAQVLGQRPALTRARRSIAAFNINRGDIIGCRATLRGNRAWEFFDRLVTIALPRIRDFRGLTRSSFDGRGNYTLGIDDQLIFPELDYDEVSAERGMDITIVTSAETDEEAMGLLQGLGLPLKREE